MCWVQPLWKTVWRFLKKLKCDPTISYMGMYQKEMKTRYQRDVCSPMFSAVLLTIRIFACACMCAQSCLILCNPIDCSTLGSSVHGILRVRILKWVAIPFSRGSSWPRDRTHHWASWELLTIAKLQKQAKCSSVGEWIKMRDTHTQNIIQPWERNPWHAYKYRKW